jgi:3-hydroxypropanoate dehydrogenase
VFVKSNEAKARLRASLSPGNLEKAMAAPVTTIVAYDVEFYDKLTKLVPYAPDAKLRVSEMEPEARRRMALMNATLQCGYAIVAARSLGLDCGPMGGFNAETLDAEFFPDHQWKSILLLNLGHGEPSTLHPRAPRLDFDEACRIV